MSRRREPSRWPKKAARARPGHPKARGRGRLAVGLGAVGILVLAGILVAPALRDGGTAGPGGLPGPLGGPSIAQDVNTLVGQRAPGFTLPDADGKTYTVAPGTGSQLVLVFHMGIT